MIKLLTRAVAVSIVLGSTAAIADEDPQSVIRMVILGTDEGNGVFSANAISISAGVGPVTIGGYVANGESGAIGTAVIAGESQEGIEGGLAGYETCVFVVDGTCP
jgi:hypothetical protein